MPLERPSSLRAQGDIPRSLAPVVHQVESYYRSEQAVDGGVLRGKPGSPAQHRLGAQVILAFFESQPDLMKRSVVIWRHFNRLLQSVDGLVMLAAFLVSAPQLQVSFHQARIELQSLHQVVDSLVELTGKTEEATQQMVKPGAIPVVERERGPLGMQGVLRCLNRFFRVTVLIANLG